MLRTRSALLVLVFGFAAFQAQAAKDGELWEVGLQMSKDGESLGAMNVNKLCFPADKNFKEPPEKDDPNCKTDVKTSGKKTTFKSVCKDADGTITSSGVSEELGPTHYKSDLTITQEMRGEPRMQHRQVGYFKKIGTACDSQALLKGFAGAGGPGAAAQAFEGGPFSGSKPGASPGAASGAASGSMGLFGLPKEASASQGSAPAGEQADSSTEELPKNAGAGEQKPDKKSEVKSVKEAVEAGKSLLRGMLKF